MKTSLPPFHITKTTRIVVEADHQLASDIALYSDFYSRVHNAKTSEADLAREMIRHCIATDSDFQSFRAKPRRRRKTQLSEVEVSQL